MKLKYAFTLKFNMFDREKANKCYIMFFTLCNHLLIAPSTYNSGQDIQFFLLKLWVTLRKKRNKCRIEHSSTRLHTHRGKEVQGNTGGDKCLSNSKMCHTSYKMYRIITDVFNYCIASGYLKTIKHRWHFHPTYLNAITDVICPINCKIIMSVYILLSLLRAILRDLWRPL